MEKQAISFEERQANNAQARASFIYWTVVEVRDGHLWGDLLMELGELITDDLEDKGHDKKRSFWASEACELAATDGFGWPAVVELVGHAMRESRQFIPAVDPHAEASDE